MWKPALARQFLLTAAILSAAAVARPAAGAEVVDRILAVVDGEVITMTDVRIVQAFRIGGGEGDEVPAFSSVFDSLVDQQLVIRLTDERVEVSEAEVEDELKAVEDRVGAAVFGARLAEFGMERDGLKDPIRQKIVFDRIIFQRFSQSIFISLRQIEEYYARVYIPGRSERGLEVKPLLDAIDEIEADLKNDLIRSRLGEWLRGLRAEAHIQIKADVSEPSRLR